MTAKGPVNDASLDAAIARAGLDLAAIRAGMADAEVGRRLAANRALAEVPGQRDPDLRGDPDGAGLSRPGGDAEAGRQHARDELSGGQRAVGPFPAFPPESAALHTGAGCELAGRA